MDRERPDSPEQAISHDEQGTSRDAQPNVGPVPNQGFGTQGSAADEVVDSHDNDFA